jgi:hypothetical protein
MKIPTLDEVKAYIKAEGYNDVNPIKWWNFYDSKGWKVGKNPMVRWKSAVATWSNLTEEQRLRYKCKTCVVCGKPAMMIINKKGYCKDKCYESTRPVRSDKPTMPVSVSLKSDTDLPRKTFQQQKQELLKTQ